MAFSQDTFRTLWGVLQRTSPIAFSSNLSQIAGSPKAGLLLSQMIYWTKRSPYIVQNEGWFFKTAKQWQLETGLTREEQDSARDAIRQLQFIEERRMGQRGMMHFRLRLNIIGEALAKHIGQKAEAMNPLGLDDLQQNSPVIRELLGRTISYHRVLRDITGNVISALLLSRMIYLQRRAIGSQGVWFSQTAEEWFQELGITRRQLDRARDRLRQLRLIEERLEFFPFKRVFVTINAQRMHELLMLIQPAQEAPEALNQRHKQPPQPGMPSGQLPNQSHNLKPLTQGETGDQALNQTHNQGSSPMQPKPQSEPSVCGFGGGQNVGLVGVSLCEMSLANKGTTVSDYNHSSQAGLSDTSGRVVVVNAQNPQTANPSPGEQALIFPSGLLDQVRLSLVSVIQQALPHRRQLLLDELAGGISTARNPIAVLRTLVRLDNESRGNLILEKAPYIAASRARAQAAARAKAEAAQRAAEAPKGMEETGGPVRLSKAEFFARLQATGFKPSKPPSKPDSNGGR